MADPRLPEDVVIEILIRLPVKSIVQLRCVSKTWFDLIKSRMFIRRQQNHERKQRVLLVERYSRQHEAILTFHDPDFPELLVYPNLSIPFLNDLKNPSILYSNAEIYGPCNGLVCIPFVDIVFLCNPALREFKPLPRLNIPCPNGYKVFPIEFGFGFDPNTGAYKVIKISEIAPDNYEDLLRKQDMYSRIDVYNSASNSWKHIDAKLPWISPVRSFHLLFRGVLHWFAGASFPVPYAYIFCFNITTEAFQLLDVPDDSPKLHGPSALMVLKENLAMVGYPSWGQSHEPREIQIWVMKEYGVKGSWTKQFVIGPYMVVCPLLFLNDEWLLVESNNGQLAVCALEGNQFKGFPFNGFDLTLSAVVFEESLISLNDIIIS